MSKHDIAESIRKLAGSANAFETFVCEVKSVDGATCTVTRVLDGLEIADVRLNCHITENEGIVVTPKINSFVLVTNIDGRQHFVSQCSEVEKITIDCDSEIIINGGDNKGIVKIQELDNNLKKLKSYIENIATATATAMAPMSALDSGASVTTFNTTVQGLKASFQWENMEDTKIKH